jgi:hypothetical protein
MAVPGHLRLSLSTEPFGAAQRQEGGSGEIMLVSWGYLA